MEKIRYLNSVCNNVEKVDFFLKKARVGVFTIWDGVYPYPMPMSYVWLNNAFYCHGSSVGKKNDLIKGKLKASICIYEDYGNTVANMPAGISTIYMSIISYGILEVLTDYTEATEALQLMLKKYVPGYFESSLKQNHVESYNSSMNAKTSIFKFIPIEITAKEHSGDFTNMFYEGRTLNSDAKNKSNENEFLKNILNRAN